MACSTLRFAVSDKSKHSKFPWQRATVELERENRAPGSKERHRLLLRYSWQMP